MNRLIKFLNCVVIILFFIFLSSCSTNKQKPIESIGQKSDKLQEDFIQFKITSVGIELKDVNNNKLNAVEVEITNNFNSFLNVKTDYSNYISKVVENNEKILLVVSDLYNSYLAVGDEFIYKLDGLVQADETDKIKEYFTTSNNEYALLPVLNNEYLLENITSNIIGPNDDYFINLLIMQRKVLYGYDFDVNFIDFDYSLAYMDYNSFILNYNFSIDRFIKSLIGLNSLNKESFYKLKYSEIMYKFYVTFDDLYINIPEIINYIDEYLNEIGGEN